MRTQICLFGLAFGICATTVYGYTRYRSHPLLPLQPLYVEITTIDEGGHPVAGSQIQIQETQMGVTDSFGQWRGLVQTRPGNKLALSIHKRRTKGQLQAKKTLQIPLELSDTSELKTTVQLTLKHHR
jgi:hypothetical protein